MRVSVNPIPTKEMSPGLGRQPVYESGRHACLFITRCQTTLRRAELAVGHSQVVAQFTFRAVLSIAFATSNLRHLFPPCCQRRSIASCEGAGLCFLGQFHPPGWSRDPHRVTRMGQLGRGQFPQTLDVTTKSIPAYREDERHRDRGARARIEEAARFRPVVSLC
jgi:hypothetical protein